MASSGGHVPLRPPLGSGTDIRTASVMRFSNLYLLSEAVLTCIHNLCLWAKLIKNNECPCKLQFYFIKMRCKGVKIIRTCKLDKHALFKTFSSFIKCNDFKTALAYIITSYMYFK